jgi:hypothetical protein
VLPGAKENTAAVAANNGHNENINTAGLNNENEAAAAGAKNNYAKTAVYKELNTDEDINRGSLYVGALEINKNKVRGFMKKVGGLFSGKSKTAMANEDGKIQVANLELNTN